MIDAANFKMRATWFRKQAKKIGLECPLYMLLDIFAYAHYAFPYARVYSMADRQGVGAPTFPPPFLEETALRFGVDQGLILKALEPQLRRQPRQTPPASTCAEAFQARAKRFAQLAPDHGLKLKMPGASDFFSRAYFDRDYAPLVADLQAGETLAWPSAPEFLEAACVLYGIDPRNALVAILRAGNEPIDA